jgi:hypothetical protein
MEATIEKEKGQHLSPTVSHDVETSKDTSIDADAMKLAAMGYTQDMKRNYSVWSIVGVGFSLTNSWVSNIFIPAPSHVLGEVQYKTVETYTVRTY